MTEFQQNDKAHLERYKIAVESKLNWGKSGDWRHQDFERLSTKIFEETGVMLSSTTLKRIWGKLKYDSVPNSNTLDALAAFIGHENWLEFKALTQLDFNEDSNGIQFPESSKKEKVVFVPQKNNHKKHWIIGAAILMLTVMGLGFIFSENEINYSAAELDKAYFSSHPVADGIPNTVVFKYDVAHLSPQKLEIQQSWNEKLRFEIDPKRKEATSIYYYPGYFRAKLLVGNQIAKEHDLYIKSDGWLVTLNKQPKPRYFLEEELIKENYLGVMDEIVLQAQAKVEDSPEVLGYHYVDDFGDLNSDNFSLEASFKNTYKEGDGVCQMTRIIILCTKGAMIIPFSIPGCVGDLRLIFNDALHQGEKHDLSPFGCDFSEWQKFRCEVKNRDAQLYLNNEPIYQLSYNESAGRIVGFRFLFTGNGEIDDIYLKGKDGQLFFEEHFSEE